MRAAHPVIRIESATLTENKIGKPAQELFHRFVYCRVPDMRSIRIDQEGD